MQVITVKYLGETNKLGPRYKATHTGNYTSVTLNIDYSLNTEGNCIAAAKALAEKLNWEVSYVGGHTSDGMVFVDSKPAYAFTTSAIEVAA
tara:strand:- start:275 stop:547 length:273 start_codon:yes stop_codon:yes gene_type:complete